MILIIFLPLFCIVNANGIGETEDKLVFVQVVFRHGERTIRKTYPTDPWNDPSHWPLGFGQLTRVSVIFLIFQKRN